MSPFLAPLGEILRDPRSAWFGSHPRRDLVERCLKEAYQELKQRLGNNTERWSWGKIHTLTLDHSFGQSEVLAPIFSIGPFPSGSDGLTLNMGYYRYSNPFKSIVGPSLRMIILLGDWERSRFLIIPGQSGHFFSPHYSDQLVLWRSGGYLKLFYREDEMKDWLLLIFAAPLTLAA